MIIVFLIGYLLIALEHPLKINKAGTALLTGTILWVLYTFGAPQFIPTASAEEFKLFLDAFPFIKDLPYADQCIRFVIDHQILDSIGEIAETLIFLIGAMITVELVDSHGGFMFITNRITTNSKRKLLFVIATITFFMSAVLDNLTTSIVMVMLIRKLIGNYKERWIFGSIIVIAANSGGAWSPIGDVTTIMLWMRGNVTAAALMGTLFVPCIVSVIIPTAIAMRYVGNEDAAPVDESAFEAELPKGVGPRLSKFILVTGVLSLLFVPVFKSITHLPPYMGMMVSLGVMWVLTEIIYDRKRGIEESIKCRVSKVLKHIDMPTILFFLGILMSVAALQSAGVLTDVANWLDKQVHEVFTIAGVIGVLSSVIDNVPLVAACMGMYPVMDAAAVAASADPAYMQSFVQDGLFWHLLTYCAGVGGSLLIIGSAAGVVAMGLEKINFAWYFKKITLLAFVGYLSGILVILLEHLLIGL